MTTTSIPDDVKSVITCDMEGRIQTFSEGAEELFGWKAEEVVGKKRVSLFSPGEVVLEHVGTWLKTADTQGKYEGDTVFLRKDGTPFSARIRITPTYRGGKATGERLGYCGVTVPIDVPPEKAWPKISTATKIFRWLVVARAPFLTVTIVPILIAAAMAAGMAGAFPWLAFALAFVGGCALHVAANVWNDYFDWTSGTDEQNDEYFLPFSGGSRSVELGLVSPKGLMKIGVGAFVVAAACGIPLAIERPVVLAFGAAGAFFAWFYTAPPLRLVARKGLGEIAVGLAFGPLMTGGAAAALGLPVDARALLVGVPVGLLTSAILYANEFPDMRSDARAGKNHLVVVLGKRAARWGYLAIVVAAYAAAVALWAAGMIPALAALLPLLVAPIAAYAVAILFKHYDDRSLVRANKATIYGHFLFGLLFAAGVLFG